MGSFFCKRPHTQTHFEQYLVYSLQTLKSTPHTLQPLHRAIEEYPTSTWTYPAYSSRPAPHRRPSHPTEKSHILFYISTVFGSLDSLAETQEFGRFTYRNIYMGVCLSLV